MATLSPRATGATAAAVSNSSGAGSTQPSEASSSRKCSQFVAAFHGFDVAGSRTFSKRNALIFRTSSGVNASTFWKNGLGAHSSLVGSCSLPLDAYCYVHSGRRSIE